MDLLGVLYIIDAFHWVTLSGALLVMVITLRRPAAATARSSWPCRMPTSMTRHPHSLHFSEMPPVLIAVSLHHPGDLCPNSMTVLEWLFLQHCLHHSICPLAKLLSRNLHHL